MQKIFFCALLSFGAYLVSPSAIGLDWATNRSVVRREDADRVRRVGLGVYSGGTAPLLGLKGEIHFTEQVSLALNYGWGSDVQAVSGELNWYSSTGRFRPYLNGGYSNWRPLRPGATADKTSPGYLADRFLLDAEKRTGIYNKSLLTGGFGLQYRQLTGNWSGTAIYIEAKALGNLRPLVVQGALAMGCSYYF